MKLTNDELDAILAAGHLRIAEPYNEKQSYVMSKHILTECTICGIKAHYTLKYILEKSKTEPVCRVHYWRHWYTECRSMQASHPSMLKDDTCGKVLSIEQATKEAEEKGCEFLGLIPGNYPNEDLFHVKCKSCGRIIVGRRGDYSCTCRRVVPYHTGRKKPKVESLYSSEVECKSWWDHSKNDEVLFKVAKTNSKKEVIWVCPECGKTFRKDIASMVERCNCPFCSKRQKQENFESYQKLMDSYVSDIPELLEAWDDDSHDPTKTLVSDNVRVRFKCKCGHHPRCYPLTYYRNGCPFCSDEIAPDGSKNYFLKHNAELSLEWNYEKNDERYTPENIKISSTRLVWWKCPQCGFEWQCRLSERFKSYGQACPSCGKLLNSFAWQYPELVEEWSQNNPVSPWTIYPGTRLQFVPEWICRNNPNHVWNAGIAGRINGGGCPECKDQWRSKVAQEYFEAAVEAFNDVHSEVPLFSESFSHNPWRADYVIQENGKSVVVEYDGAYWHIGKDGIDKRKSMDLLNAGYIVIRLREDNLTSLDINNPRYHEIRVHSSSPDPYNVTKQIEEIVR